MKSVTLNNMYFNPLSVRHAHPDNRIHRVMDCLKLWIRRSESRQHMLELDDHILDDVGLTRFQLQAEAVKPFWRNR